MTETKSSSLPTPRSKRSRLSGWLQWVLVAFLFLACALFVDYGEVVGILRRASIGWFFAAVAVTLVDRVLMAWKWSLLLRALDVDLPLALLVRYYFQATLAAIFLPTSVAGDLLRGHWVSQKIEAVPRVYASVLMEKGIGFLSAANWALLAGGFLLAVERSEERIAWIAAALAGLLILNFTFWAVMRPRFHRVMQRLLERPKQRKLVTLVRKLYEAFADYGHKNTTLIVNGLLTFFEHFLQMVVYFLLSLSLGIETAPLLFFAVSAVHLLVYRLPISPDGWGTGELAAIGFFGLIGISAEDAFSLAFLAHVSHLVVALPGLWFLLESTWRGARER